MSEVLRVAKPPLSHVRVLISQGKLEEALIELSSAVRRFPEWAEPWALVAQVLSLKCRYPDALTAAEEALQRDSGHLWAQELRTGLLLQLQQPEEARIAATRLVAMSPNRAESHAFLAFAEAFRGNDRQALHAARKARSLAPNEASGHRALCVVHLAFRRWQKAEHHAKASIAIDPNAASVFHDLGVAQFEQGRFEQACRSMERAVELDSRYVSALENLSRRVPHGVAPLPVLIAMAAGIAAIPLGRMPLAFVAVVTIGVTSLLLAARRTGQSKTLHPDFLRPALFAVLGVDVFVVLQYLGVFR